MRLKLDKRETDQGVIITVDGEVDLYTSRDLRTAILAASPRNNKTLAVDLRHVPYMDSSGVATLVEGLKRAGQTGAAFVLLAPSSAVMKVLQLSRLDTVFDILADPERRGQTPQDPRP